MNRDVLTGVIGAALLVVAMVGVFAYERAAAGEDGEAQDTVLPPRNPAVDSLTGTVAVGASDSKTVPIPASSASNATFHLSWAATNGRDTLQFSLVAPAGSNITEGLRSPPSDNGRLTLAVRIPSGANATGEWKVTVQFVNAEPALLPGGIPPPTPPPNSTDASVAYRVDVALG